MTSSQRFVRPLLAMLLLSGCAVLDPSPEAVISGPPPADTPTGKELYDDFCGTCHRPDGTPVDPTATPSLRGYDAGYASFDSLLLQGPGAMPIFPYSELDSTERRLILEHIKTFR